jgi:nitroreductase
VELLTAIQTRHSIARVRPDPVPRAVIEQLLHAAVQAPNHYHNRPWHFVVLSGAARERLGEVMAQSQARRVPDSPDQVLEIERKRPLRAPVLIAVGVDPADPANTKILEIENLCAAAAAVENLLLAAHDLGLGAIWRTGAAAIDPAVKDFLGFSPQQKIIALVYVGYPEHEQVLYQRLSFEDRVTWMDE